MLGRPVEEHSVIETLDAVEACFLARVEADADMFVLAAHFADLHSADSLRAAGNTLPGTERAVRLGGEGTPPVAEFAPAELGARMRLGTVAARFFIADALDVRHRLPRLWAKVVAREARVSYVRFVAARTRHLSPEAAGFVDAAVADDADGSVPWSRFEARVLGKVVAADPEAAAAAERAKAAEQFARKTRSSEHGTRGFYLRSTIGVVARFDATVAFLAEALRVLGDADDEDTRRVKACVLMANPTKAVELMAAFAAHRAGGSMGTSAGTRGTQAGTRPVGEDVPLPLPRAGAGDAHDRAADPEDPEDAEDAEDAEQADVAGAVRGSVPCSRCGGADGHSGESPTEPAGPLGRTDAFARSVVLRPERLPGWLAALATTGIAGTTSTSSTRDAAGTGDTGDAAGTGDTGGAAGTGDTGGAAGTGDTGGAGDAAGRRTFCFDWSGLLPPVTLNLHLAAETLAAANGGVVRWEGEGPVTHQFVHDHLRPLHRYVIQPVVDLAGQAPVDAYEIPDRHRRAVRLRTPADCFPYSSNTSDAVDIDHTVAYGSAGSAREQAFASRLENYGPLGRFHHRIKTHGQWRVRQPFSGIFVWRDPHGQIYLVDHTGTRKVTAPGTAAGPANPFDTEVEVYEGDTVLEMERRHAS